MQNLARKNKREAEQSLIRWRRKQVAELWFSGEDVKSIASALQVSTRTIYEDQEYIETHADDLMKNYIVRTVPHIINRSLYQIDIANRQAMDVMKTSTNNKERIAAVLAVARTARDVVEIIAGNKGVVDKALELDSSLSSSLSSSSDQQNEDDKGGEEIEKEEEEGEEEEQQQDHEQLLSRNSTEEQAEAKDPERVF